jgi:two-component system, OmpR family, KDP operon response regulator KdpE
VSHGRVLAVDDEPQILKALATNLSARGYDVDVAPDGETAVRLAADRHPDLVILDLGLPGMSGVEVIDALRSWTSTPIIVLSARDTDPDKITALDAGADDYVTKPFSIGELMARVRAALRRATVGENEQAEIVTDDFTIDLAAHTVSREGEAVHLTPIEWRLVEALVRHPGRLISQRQLLQTVWGPSYEDETNYLRVHMTHVRRKLEPDPTRPRYFHTEPGMGYRYEPPDE